MKNGCEAWCYDNFVPFCPSFTNSKSSKKYLNLKVKAFTEQENKVGLAWKNIARLCLSVSETNLIYLHFPNTTFQLNQEQCVMYFFFLSDNQRNIDLFWKHFFPSLLTAFIISIVAIFIYKNYKETWAECNLNCRELDVDCQRSKWLWLSELRFILASLDYNTLSKQKSANGP